MSELFSAVTGDMFEQAKSYAVYLNKKGCPMDELWRYMGGIISSARALYRKTFVDWFEPSHVELAQRELADAVIAELWAN